MINNELHDDEIFINLGIIKNRNFTLYEISNYGKVRNSETMNILSPGISNTGYLIVSLVDKNTNKIDKGHEVTQKIHKLVAFKFCGGYSDKTNYVNHIDENRLNNHYKNLEWCTNKYNITYSVGKKVNQIDISNGHIIQTFNSLAEAAKSCGKDNAMCIIRVCQGVKKSAYGFKWSYAFNDRKFNKIIDRNEKMMNESKENNNNIQFIHSQLISIFTI